MKPILCASAACCSTSGGTRGDARDSRGCPLSVRCAACHCSRSNPETARPWDCALNVACSGPEMFPRGLHIPAWPVLAALKPERMMWCERMCMPDRARYKCGFVWCAGLQPRPPLPLAALQMHTARLPLSWPPARPLRAKCRRCEQQEVVDLCARMTVWSSAQPQQALIGLHSLNRHSSGSKPAPLSCRALVIALPLQAHMQVPSPNGRVFARDAMMAN